MILDEIVAATKQHVARDKENVTQSQLENRFPAGGCRPFAVSLKHPDRLGLIAEIKRASPSRGVIAPDFDHQRMAALYGEAGADCLSVLTEPEFFLGDLHHLSEAREISGKPCLRKDFIVDQYQIAQARAFGADCILLIAAILKDWEVRAFKHAARRYGMDTLFEVHDELEARRAAANGCTLIGINNRDLRTFEVNLATTERLRPLLPEEATVVAESGVASQADAHRLRAAGVDALLVGETLMRSGDPAVTIGQLLG